MEPVTMIFIGSEGCEGSEGSSRFFGLSGFSTWFGSCLSISLWRNGSKISSSGGSHTNLSKTYFHLLPRVWLFEISSTAIRSASPHVRHRETFPRDSVATTPESLPDFYESRAARCMKQRII